MRLELSRRAIKFAVALSVKERLFWTAVTSLQTSNFPGGTESLIYGNTI
jgi:hypothetical protein